MGTSTIIKVILGFITLALGFIGLLIPVWPTTPFVLVSVGCFSSTPGMQKKVLRLPFVKEYYRSYTEKRGLSWSTVAVSLTFLWGMMILSAVLTRKPLIIAILALVGTAVTIHILWIARLHKGRKEEEKEHSDEQDE